MVCSQVAQQCARVARQLCKKSPFPRRVSIPRPTAQKTVALPLSYGGNHFFCPSCANLFTHNTLHGSILVCGKLYSRDCHFQRTLVRFVAANETISI